VRQFVFRLTMGQRRRGFALSLPFCVSWKAWRVAAISAVSVLLLDCGGGGSQPSPQAITISVSPSQASVPANGSLPLYASVSGTPNTAVTWEVNGIVGGNGALGTITAEGVYTAPGMIPHPATVAATAVSQADSAKSASASLTVTVAISVSPQGPLWLTLGQSQQFSANVVGSANTAATWNVNGIAGGNAQVGSITNQGLYSAPTVIPVPSSVRVFAVAEADTKQEAGATVSILAAYPFSHQVPQNAPIKLGTSGGNADEPVCCSGTLGALVTRNGSNFLLSNNHVLGRSGQAKPGEPITQPGLVDSGCTPATVVARFSQAAPLQNDGVDAALAAVVPAEVDGSGMILDLGPVVEDVPQPAAPAQTTVSAAVGMLVAKSGRTTGLACGLVNSTNTTVAVEYPTPCANGQLVSYENQIVVTGWPFALPGDSGSLIVDAQTAQATALLFAGDEETGFGIGNPIQDVLNGLANPATKAVPSFVGGGEHPVGACSTGSDNLATSARSGIAISPEEVQRAAAVKAKYVEELMRDSAVVGVGVGAGEVPGKAAVVVYVNKNKPARTIPPVLDGIATRIFRVGPFRAYFAASPACSGFREKPTQRLDHR